MTEAQLIHQAYALWDVPCTAMRASNGELTINTQWAQSDHDWLATWNAIARQVHSTTGQPVFVQPRCKPH